MSTTTSHSRHDDTDPNVVTGNEIHWQAQPHCDIDNCDDKFILRLSASTSSSSLTTKTEQGGQTQTRNTNLDDSIRTWLKHVEDVNYHDYVDHVDAFSNIRRPKDLYPDNHEHNDEDSVNSEHSIESTSKAARVFDTVCPSSLTRTLSTHSLSTTTTTANSRREKRPVHVPVPGLPNKDTQDNGKYILL